jgi:hypothetical protein
MKKLAKKERTIRRQAPQHLVTAHEEREGYQLVWSRNAPSRRHTLSAPPYGRQGCDVEEETSQQQKTLMPPKSRRKKAKNLAGLPGRVWAGWHPADGESKRVQSFAPYSACDL